MRKTKPLSGSGKKEMFEYSRKIDSKRKGRRKRKLEQYKNLHLPFCLVKAFAGNNRADGYQDEPVRENDSEGELVAVKRDEKFPHQDDLCNDPAQTHDEEGEFEEERFHIFQKF